VVGFKLRGQMDYLSIERGRLIVTKVGDYGLPFYNEKMEPHGIEVVLLDDFTVPSHLASKPVSEDALQVWRYSFWIERILLKKLTGMAKNWLDKTMPAVVNDYRRLINDEIFFSPTGTDRADRLYEAYKEHPSLTLDCADDLAGTYPDLLHEAGRQKIGEAFNLGIHPLLQICMYLEQRARIAILKGATDAICDAGGSAKVSALWKGLPASFVAALGELEKMPGFWKYRVFWQVFIWGWGGFLLTEQDELALVAEEAGLSIPEAEAALTAFDLVFPMQGLAGCRRCQLLLTSS
jgi:hypothetical protein